MSISHTQDEALNDEVVPGLTLDQISEHIVEGCLAVAAPWSFDPVFFIRQRIESTVQNSNSPADIKTYIKFDSSIDVDYIEPEPVRRSDWLNGEKPPVDWRSRTFTLAEICTDYHHRVLKEKGYKRVNWPEIYSSDLRRSFEDADYQSDFRRHVADTLKQPTAHAFGELLKTAELNREVVKYIQSDRHSMDDRIIAFEFLKGIIPARTLNLHSDPDLAVDNAVFIGRHNLANGVLFFLGGDNATFEFPEGHEARGKFLEKNEALQEMLLKRVPLRDQQKGYVKNFKYKGLEFPLFATRPHYREVVFRPQADIGKILFERHIARALADIDTLVSTSAERMTDIALESVGYLLQCLSVVATLPLGGTGALATTPVKIMISFLLGMGVSVTELARAELSDDPEEADRLRMSAAIGAIVELAGPIAEKIVGKALSKIAKKNISRRVGTFLHSANRPSLLRKPSSSIANQVTGTTGKEIPGAAKGINVSTQLGNLAGGPHLAQKLATETQWVRLCGPEKGYVYQGFVFRGDMREPSIIFEEGFRLRTPITDINQVNGFKGGYGGAHDALAFDGAGISTSAFYKKDGAGAFVYGGDKGGFTYFIDARQIEGFHLYANTELAFRPNSPLKQLPPLEINYGVDLPPSAVLGAYDKDGVFISNPKAITRAINSSENEISDGIVGRAVKEGIKEASKDGDILDLHFGNDAIAETEQGEQAADAGPLPGLPTPNRVTSSDIDAFRERQAEKRRRESHSKG